MGSEAIEMAFVAFILLFLFLASLTRCQTNVTGLVAAGGNGGLTTAEFWAKMPQEAHCSLPSFPEELYDPTLDVLQDRIIACYERRCYQLVGGEWIVWATTAEVRKYHTSAVTEEGLLLVGGTVEPTRTELIPLQGGTGVASFQLERPGWKDHCSVQVSDSTMILTGGQGTDALVTEYTNLGSADKVIATPLTSLTSPRHHHACGLVTTAGSHMLIVTGGFQGHSLDSTEVMDYTDGIAGRWWPANPLPSPRDSLHGASIDGLFYLAGGNTYPDGYTTEVLVWDPAAEVWMVAGQLESARQRHALASVSLQLLTSVAPGCSF